MAGALIYRPYNEIRSAITDCLKKKRPFTVIFQNETVSFQSKWGSGTTRQNRYSIDDINFIKSVKHYIVKNELYIPYLNFKIPGDGKVKYFQYSSSLKANQKIKNVINVDLSGAYWEAAYKLGLISDVIYQKGLTVDKFVRLTAIGSLAKKVYKLEYDGKRQKKKEVISSELTECLWDVICMQVSNVLQDAANAAGKDFIFFWVDGIYIRTAALKSVEKCFKKHGYKFKIDTSISSIETTQKHLFVNLTKPIIRVINGKETKVFHKPFPFRGRSISGAINK